MISFFFALLKQLLPLYFYIFLGFVSAKFLNSTREILARVMFYGIAPLIIFGGVMKTRLDAATLSLPIIILFLSSFLCLLFYKLGKPFLKDSSSHLLALCAGTANTGYFGLPIAVMLFDSQTIGSYILGMMGIIAFESSLGFYISARGNYTVKECVIKVLTLPTLHALILAITFNFLQYDMPASYASIEPYVMKIFTIVGMMII